MRLAEREKGEILAAIRRFDADARVFLFGSRANDTKRGGDIDLLILSDKLGLAERNRIRRLICDAIGDQKIDILIAADTTDPMVRLAKSTGVPLQ